MLAIAVCGVALVACFWAGRRSLGQGLAMLFAFGYFYGILRANLITAVSHFIFDAALLGFYLSIKWSASTPEEKQNTRQITNWTIILIAWPLLILLLPFQPLLVSLVGLRANIYFVPLLLLGSRLKSKDFIHLSLGLAALDLVALGFASAEYFMGVPRFFPYSAVTQIIYMSGDVAGGFFRIPGTFSSAHAFGGTMVASMPFLVGLWIGGGKPIYRLLGLISLPAALLGVLMSATRQNFIFACAIVVFVLFAIPMKRKQRFFFILILIALGGVALKNERFQRFKSLDDSEYIASRVAGSVNRGFWEILTEYPMGNGLGGGGTSMPYFLQGQVKNPIGMENEYARILSEQGIVGLLIWVCFLVWAFSRFRITFAKGPWSVPRKLLWGFALTAFGTAWIGTGLLTSIPQTVLIIIGMGWMVAPSSSGVPLATDPLRWALQRRGKTQVPAFR